MERLSERSLWCLMLEMSIASTLFGLAILYPQNSVMAQIPNRIVPKSPEQTVPEPKPLPTVPLEIPTPSPPAPGDRGTLPANIVVTQFVFEGNTAFSDEAIAKVTAPFINRPIAFTELLQAEAAVTKLYVEAGYINSGAVILAGQTLSPQGAVVKIQVIEGGIEEIQVTGTKRLKPSYVQRRLELATAKPFNQNRLLKALQLLQLNPLIQTISADLAAGARPELSVLNVSVKEAKTFHAEVFADNSRAPSVGSFRRGVRVSQDNLLGYGDGLALEYSNTNGSNSINVSYTWPLNARNGTLTLAGGASDSQIIETPFDGIDITGKSYFVDLTYRQPIIQTPTQELAVGITASRQENQSRLLGNKIPLSQGADENGNTRIAALRVFQEWTQRSAKDVFSARSQFNFGLGILDATINAEPPDSRFFNWRGQAQYVRQFAPETLLVLRSELQLSPHALNSLEQYSLGGQQSVRGYRQDAISTDNGLQASAELQFPILRVKKINGVLQVVPFVDVGLGWNGSGNPDPNPNLLVGAGVGLQWRMGDRLSARFDWGIPLINVDAEKKTLQEQGLYFSINYSLF